MPDSDTRLPAELTAGLSFSVCLDLPTFPAPDWSLALYLRGPQAIDLSAVPDGSRHQFSASAEQTGAWAPGEYWHSVRATSGETVIEVARGRMVVREDLATQTAGYDGRSDARKALDAIKAVLDNRATIDQERYRINNRELYRTPIRDLLKLRAFYQHQVNKEDRSSSKHGRAIPVRFS